MKYWPNRVSREGRPPRRTTGRPNSPHPWHDSATLDQYHLWIEYTITFGLVAYCQLPAPACLLFTAVAYTFSKCHSSWTPEHAGIRKAGHEAADFLFGRRH